MGEFASLDPEAADASDIGAHIRWGGRLLQVLPERERTCFEILSLPLDGEARPKTIADPGRRFLACREGFADPAAFPDDRPVTVTGRLTGFVTREIGDYDYLYPVVRIESLFVWPERPEYHPYPSPMPWWHHPYHAWGLPYPRWH